MRAAIAIHVLFGFFAGCLVAGCGDSGRRTAPTDSGAGGSDGAIRDSGPRPDGARPDSGGGGFDSGMLGDGGGGEVDAGGGTDAGSGVDSGGPGCAAMDLGSATGLAVAMGTTVGAGDDWPADCAGSGGSDVAYLWTVPADGSYIIDTIGSDYDTALTVHAGVCGIPDLACADDLETGDLVSRIALDFTAGARVTIVVDGYDGDASGNYVLNITAHPGFENPMCSNATDDDRDGFVDCDDFDCDTDPSCVGMPAPSSPGDVVVTEIMNDPSAISDTAGEWFELFNPRTTAFDLNGCTIRDLGTSMHVIASSVVIAPGAYIALASSTMPGFTPAYAYAGVAFNNTGTDGVVIACGAAATVIDQVSYTVGTWPTAAGRSMSLRSTALDSVSNDNVANWCSTATTVTYGSGDSGSPGAVNPACP